MSEVIIAVLILLLFFMAWSLHQATKKLKKIEYAYVSLSANYVGRIMAMYDIKYSERELNEKLDAYYSLADHMTDWRIE